MTNRSSDLVGGKNNNKQKNKKNSMLATLSWPLLSNFCHGFSPSLDTFSPM